MSEPSNHQPSSRLESGLTQAASAFPYPPTPDIAGQLIARLNQPRLVLQRQRTRWGGAILVGVVILLSLLLSVPPVRAALLDFLQIGAVRIWFVEPSLTSTPIAPPTATSRMPVLNVAGETTLAEAQLRVKFPIHLPTIPPDLGPPDKVYLQDLDGAAVILVWLDHSYPGQVRMSLHLLISPTTVRKMVDPSQVTPTRVHNRPAVWTDGPYLLTARNGRWTTTRLLQGHTLIWQAGAITYRLESSLTLPEAVRVAESLP